MILLIYYKIPTVLHYRGYQKKSGCKHFITRLHIEKNEPEMFTDNKIYERYRTGNDFFRIKKKKKNEIGKNQSGDSVEQDINLVWPKETKNIFLF